MLRIPERSTFTVVYRTTPKSRGARRPTGALLGERTRLPLLIALIGLVIVPALVVLLAMAL